MSKRITLTLPDRDEETVRTFGDPDRPEGGCSGSRYPAWGGFVGGATPRAYIGRNPNDWFIAFGIAIGMRTDPQQLGQDGMGELLGATAPTTLMKVNEALRIVLALP